MQITIQQIGFHDFQTEIYHMLKLFFEDVDVSYEVTDAPDFRLVLEAHVQSDSHQVTIHASLERCDRNELWTEQVTRPLSAKDEEGRRRQMKRAVGSALLQTLQAATGLEQPWGILTGVRPMKLLHNMLRENTMETCRRILREDYLLAEHKIELLTQIAERQLQAIPDLFQLDREVSLYIGIPFCPTKCAYCTFPAYDIRGNSSVNAFLEGLHYEIRETGRWLKEAGLGITTIYWGGGTPTSITAEEMDALFAAIHESMPGVDRVRELTVEAGRPDTITPDKIRTMQKWKVDRISINPQSFTQETLDAIGRHHTVKETVEKFKLSRELGMNNINMDLIIGLPNEGMKELELSLSETDKLMPESLTVHTLSFKRASRMTQHRDQFDVAERDEIQEMMRRAAEWTKARGYHPYYMYRQKNILGNQENVGYAQEGFDSLYNIIMMEERQTIIGLGCGAVSKIMHRDETLNRFPNPKDPIVYNSAFKDYTEKKLKLLDEAYGLSHR